jgi:two-component system chemotaxis sensor kinase CheA
LFTDGLTTRAGVTEFSGRGVGLGAVREACRALGGTVEIDSERGVGTTFRFVWPARVVTRHLGPAAGSTARASQAPPDLLSRSSEA